MIRALLIFAIVVAVVPATIARAADMPVLDPLPLYFVPADASYVARARGYTVAIDAEGVVLVLPGGSGTVTLRFEGPAPRAALEPLDRTPARTSYFVGADPRRHRAGIPTYARVRHNQIYPGVDVVYYGSDDRLEYDLRLAPGTDVTTLDRVRIRIGGADDLRIEADGSLEIVAGGGVLRQLPPRVLLERDGRPRIVTGGYRLNGDGTVGFEVAEWDPTATLVIDPVLVFSTYLGGGKSDVAHAVAVDRQGFVYVAGSTTSLNFPSAAPLQAQCGSCSPTSSDSFLVKLTPDGSTVVYATFLGGAGTDSALGVAVDDDGAAYVTGSTDSLDFPVVAPPQVSRGGGFDAFVARISPAGDALEYATYLGGSGDDVATAIAVTSGRSAVVVGRTGSPDFPTVAALQPSMDLGGDAFVTKLDPDGGSLTFSTFLGGPERDEARAVALDAQRDIYLAGDIAGAGFAKIDRSGAVVRYLANPPLAGASVNAIGVDASGQIVIGGSRPACDGNALDGFVARYAPTGGLLALTDLARCSGGTTTVAAIAPEVTGGAYVAGTTSTRALEACPTEPHHGGLSEDAFVAHVASDGTLTSFATNVGGQLDDRAHGVATGPTGSVWLVGETVSADFPTAAALQPELANDAGRSDAFVARLLPTASSGPPVGEFRAVPRSGPAPLSASFADESVCSVDAWRWTFGDGTSSTQRNPTHTYAADGSYTVTLEVISTGGQDVVRKLDYVTVGDAIQAEFTVDPADGLAPLSASFANLTIGSATSYLWEFGDGSTSSDRAPTHVYRDVGAYGVTLTATGPTGLNSQYHADVVHAREIVPCFEAAPRVLRPGATFQLVDGSQGAVLGRDWTFGDGAFSTQTNPTHAYAEPGYYTVALTATGATTTETHLADDYVLVSSFPPTDIVTGPGGDPAAAPRSQVFDVLGTTSAASELFAYGAGGFGLNVATGDLDGNLQDEILTGPGPGPVLGPHVRAFRPDATPLPKVSFFASATSRFGTGVDAAHLGRAANDEILTSAAPAVAFGPHVRGFSLAAGRVTAISRLCFYAYATLHYGVDGDHGDVDGDGLDEILTAPGPGPTFAPTIHGYRFDGSLEAMATLRFDAYAAASYGGRVGSSNLDGIDAVLASPGPGPLQSARVRGFLIAGGVAPMSEVDFEPFPLSAYGAEPLGGDVDGDTYEEIVVGRGPDPAAAGDVRGFDYGFVLGHIPSKVVTAIPSLSFSAHPWRYGLHAATGDFGF